MVFVETEMFNGVFKWTDEQRLRNKKKTNLYNFHGFYCYIKLIILIGTIALCCCSIPKYITLFVHTHLRVNMLYST